MDRRAGDDAPVIGVCVAAGADRHRQHRALADEAAVLEALPARIGLAIGEHAVEPAFQHRRRQMPPHRISQDDEVGAVHQRQFVGHRFRQRARPGMGDSPADWPRLIGAVGIVADHLLTSALRERGGSSAAFFLHKFLT